MNYFYYHIPNLNFIRIDPYKCHYAKCPMNAKLLSYLGSILPRTIKFDNCMLFTNFLCDLICTNFIYTRWRHNILTINTHPYTSLNDTSNLTMFWYQKEAVWRTSFHHKSKLCTYNFCNLYPAIQALLQHIGATVPTEHKSLYPNETLGTPYLSILFGSLCSIRQTITKNNS
jgi:hypothetical protein